MADSMPLTDPARANPDPHRLADERDTDGWDRERDGRMADHATADDTVETVPYE